MVPISGDADAQVRSPVRSGSSETSGAIGMRMRAAVLTGSDAGSATVAAAFAMVAIMVVIVLVVQVGAAVAARHHAQSAADLAALAAAGALDRGNESGCTAAEDIARRMQVRVVSCRIVEWDAIVTVSDRASLSIFGTREVRAAARAGPVDTDGHERAPP